MSKLFIPILYAFCLSAFAQGTVVFDQQSSTDQTAPPYGAGGAMQNILPPWGQSFTPSLPAVGFIRLMLIDGNTFDGLGATVFLNLRSGSISGPIIGVTSPVSMPSLFRGVAEFTFPTALNVTPETTYFYEPVVASGGTWNILGASEFQYSRGTAYENGIPAAYDDWFREGIVVPEPATASLLLLGSAALFYRSRLNRHQR